MVVNSKSEFFALSKQLVFGNRLRQWGWYEYLQLRGDEIPRRVSVRNCIAGGDTRVQRYRLLPRKATEHCLRLLRSHIVEPGQLLLDESAPDDVVQLQAEVMNDERFLWIRYLTAPRATGIGMRQAYPLMSFADGLHAVSILKRQLDANSWEQLCWILRAYPDSVVELSSYSCSLGVLGWNTIFWEVRNY